MQLLYGNNGVNYDVIAKSKEITSEQERELFEKYLGYGFVPDASKYSSVYSEPVALSCVTTNLNHTLPEKMVLLTKNAKMSNYSTPSYYSHSHFLKVNKDTYGERFFDLLQFAFIRDVDIKNYVSEDIDNFIQRKEIGIDPVKRDVIEKKKMVPIVAAVLSVLDGVSKQVHLVLDVEGDGYNQRALEVIASIYTYLPGTIRKKAGFSTYAVAGSNSSNLIKLQLHTRDALNKLGSKAIDLANIQSNEIMRTVSEDIADIAKVFVEQSTLEREKLFGQYQTAFGLNTVTLKDHIDLYRYLNIWQKGKWEEIKDDLARYANTEMRKREKSYAFAVFKSILDRRCKGENFALYYEEMMAELLRQQKNVKFDDKMKAYIMLGEAVDGFRFDARMFQQWENEVIIANAGRCYEDLDLYTYLNNQLSYLRNTSIGGKKYAEIAAAMESYLAQYAQKIKEGIIEKEKKGIQIFFEKYDFGRPVISYIDEQYGGVRNLENQFFFKQEMSRNLASFLENIFYLNRYKTYELYKKFIADCKKYIPEEDYQQLVEAIEEKGKIVRTIEEHRYIVWLDRISLLSTYRNLADIRAVSENREVEIPDFILTIEKDEYILTLQETEILTENLLCPISGSSREFKWILCEQINLVKNLLKIKVFSEGHFELLMTMSRESDREQIIKYYLQKNIMLSQDTIEHCLRLMDRNRLRLLSDETIQDNILGITLRKIIKEERINHEQEEIRKKIHQSIKKEEADKPEQNKRDKKFFSPGILIATLLPGILFAAGVFTKLLVSDEIFIPIGLSVVGFFVFLVALIGQSMRCRHPESIYIGSMIGGLASVLAAWTAWWLEL